MMEKTTASQLKSSRKQPRHANIHFFLRLYGLGMEKEGGN